jgi:hypothetical protein
VIHRVGCGGLGFKAKVLSASLLAGISSAGQFLPAIPISHACRCHKRDKLGTGSLKCDFFTYGYRKTFPRRVVIPARSLQKLCNLAIRLGFGEVVPV